MERQAMIQKPIVGDAIVPIRRRQLNGETLETKPIVDILLQKHQPHRKQTYLVRVEDGTSHRVERVGQNPKYLVFYNGQPMATCGYNYVPLFNSEVEACLRGALSELGREPVEVQYAQGFHHADIRTLQAMPDYHVMDAKKRSYKWRMTATLEKDFEVPVGHLKQNEKFDWGIGITNSYDLSEGIHVMLYIYRQICSNGLYGWSVSGQRNFIHVEKELSHDAILGKITEGVKTIVADHMTFFTRLDEMSKVMPTRDQAKLLMRRLAIRKYEASILADHGVMIEFDKSDIKDVTFSQKVNSEYDVLNALTAMSKSATSLSRQLDLQTGLMEKILQARTVVPSL